MPPDARIHFAINCGARSCPPACLYHPETLDDELEEATRSFVNREVALEGGVISASPVFQWFRADFADLPGGLSGFLARYLANEAVRRALLDGGEATCRGVPTTGGSHANHGRLTALIDRSGLTLGSLAGLIGISCCVAPTILALFGLISASVAIGLGITLYSEYGWYFRGAGLVFAAIGVGGLLSRRQSCSLAGARAQWRLLACTVLSMVFVYAALYWLTTLLARAASR